MNNRKSASEILRERYMASQIQKSVADKQHPSLDDIAGIEYIRKEIENKMYNPLFNVDKYTKLGATPPKSVLVRGIEGIGKTFLVECFAQQYRIPVISGFMGSVKEIKDIFGKARANEKCIVLVKNIDHIVGEDDLLYQLRESMKMGERGMLVVLCHTNVVSELKYDNEIFIKIPETMNRKKILDRLLCDMRTDGLDTFLIAQHTPGFVPANLVKLVGMAVGNAIDRINSASCCLASDDRKRNDVFTGDCVPMNGKKGNDGIDGPCGIKDGTKSSDNIIMGDFMVALKSWRNLEENITFDDIGALKEVKDELEMSILLPSRHSEKFARFGITRPSGVLLYGPPGCGKTLIAKAVSCMSYCNFLAIKGPELITKYVGDSEKHLRDLFEKARNMSPCVLFFDEIDSLCSKRGHNEFGNRIVNQILTLLDGIEDRGEVYIIGATNRIERIDPALMRSGRFDKVIEVPLPGREEGYDIFEKCIKKVPYDSFDFCSMDFSGMSGADIAGIVKEAAVLCLKENFDKAELKVGEHYFNLALSKFREMKKKPFKKK